MRPNADCPVPHFFSLKSSVNEAGTVAFALAFAFVLAFALVVTFALRFSLRTFAFELFVLLDRLASAMTSTTRPTPIITSVMNPPSIHQIAFDFLRGGAAAVGPAVGPGVHCCGGVAGGGGAGVGRVGAVTAGSGR